VPLGIGRVRIPTGRYRQSSGFLPGRPTAGCASHTFFHIDSRVSSRPPGAPRYAGAVGLLDWQIWGRLDELDRRAGIRFEPDRRESYRKRVAFGAGIALVIAVVQLFMQEWVLGGFFLAIVVYSLVERRYCFWP
jgi:hypothetical protein